MLKTYTPTNVLVVILVICSSAATVIAQWDPDNGLWGKSHPADVRVMTWNVEDGITTTESKILGLNNWHALVLIVASMQPDVLLLQEAADSGGGADSVSEMETVIDLFWYGGTDPFEGGQVTSYVQLFAPEYDLPYVFISTTTDGFNRNVILSRFPFADLNGDGRSLLSNIPLVFSDEYAPGGTGGIRGFMFAELDLPDDDYAGDLVVGNCHLKAYGDSDSMQQRLEASQNVAYYIDYLLNGAGTGQPDPHNKIRDIPAATSILGTHTPVVWGGDWNEDELTNGRKGPAAWFTQAQIVGSPDGTDRDRGDCVYDEAVHYFTGSRGTRSSSKLDYIAWQDSIVSARRTFVFNTSGTPLGGLPEIIADGLPNPFILSGIASDHRPVIADLILPAAILAGDGDVDVDGDIDLFDAAALQACFGGEVVEGCQFADLTGDGHVEGDDFVAFYSNVTGPAE